MRPPRSARPCARIRCAHRYKHKQRSVLILIVTTSFESTGTTYLGLRTVLLPEGSKGAFGRDREINNIPSLMSTLSTRVSVSVSFARVVIGQGCVEAVHVEGHGIVHDIIVDSPLMMGPPQRRGTSL